MSSEKTAWEKFLEEILEDQEQTEALRRWIKSLILNERNDQALVLLGPGRSGKSTLMHVLDALADCTSVILSGNVIGTLHGRHTLKSGKLALIYGAECLFDDDSAPVVKAILAGESITSQRNSRSVQHDWIPRVSLAIEANYLRGDLADDPAMQRRVLLVRTRTVSAERAQAGLVGLLLFKKKEIKAWVFGSEGGA